MQDACIKQSTQYSGSKVVMRFVARSTGLLSVMKQNRTPDMDASVDLYNLLTVDSSDQPATAKPRTVSAEPTTTHKQEMRIGVMDIGFLNITVALDTKHRFQHVDMESNFFMPGFEF